MQKYAQQHSGFSLVEVLIYLAVTIVIAMATINMYYSLDSVLLRNSTERKLTNAATVTLERMVRDIRNADAVDIGLSTLGTSPGVLVLEDGATVTQFSLNGGSVEVAVDGSTLGPLTSDDVTVEDLIFRRYQNATTELVRVELTLSASSRAASTTKTFYTSAVLRGTYE